MRGRTEVTTIEPGDDGPCLLWCGAQPGEAFRAWVHEIDPVVAWSLDREAVAALELPFPPPATSGVWRPRFQGEVDGPGRFQPLLPSASEEGTVSLVFAGGRIVQASRTIPVRGQLPVVQELGLFQGEDDVAKAALQVVMELHDAALGRRPPWFLQVDLLRCEGAPVIVDLWMIGPTRLHAAAASALAEVAVERMR